MIIVVVVIVVVKGSKPRIYVCPQPHIRVESSLSSIGLLQEACSRQRPVVSVVFVAATTTTTTVPSTASTRASSVQPFSERSVEQ